MSRYILSPEAGQDLKEIRNYIARYNRSAAQRLVKLIKEKCNLIADFPNLGQSYANFDPSLRGFPTNDYIIFYRPIKNGIQVVRVLSGHRDLEAIFAPDDEDS